MDMREIVIYGDSISTGAHGGGGYQPMLESAFPAAVHNHSVGGSGLCTATPQSLLSRIDQPGILHPGASLILIWLGTNDWYWGASLGGFDHPQAGTFRGAMALLLKALRRHCPGARILWPTPLWRYEQPHGCRSAGVGQCTPNRSGITLADIAAAVEEGAERFGFTAPNMLGGTGISAQNAPTMLEDGVHPTRAGYGRIAPVLVQAIEALLGQM